ncbi:pyridoxamine 5'-phosphate oxidase [Acuticoccus sediminis]|uniref:Pyridoxamine 5'-phosphate oxidase n=2 Tax=Acuticoccus sediminis TaxID=2184697 RepID=A0A8B2NJJ8_9HYPH|nr:pyridoxamine 5'-phosphate oxidase [Acuticoccus sediminis]
MSVDVPGCPGDLDAVEAAAWAMLEEGAASRQAAFRRMTLASVGTDGAPEARTVVLRGADRAQRSIRFYTDVRSPKVAELEVDPRCAAVFYDHAAGIQVRLGGRAVLHRGDAGAAAEWAAMGAYSKICYAQKTGPGVPVDGPEPPSGPAGFDTAQSFANFVLVTVHIASLDWLFLSADGHRRARLWYDDARSPTWLAP